MNGSSFLKTGAKILLFSLLITGPSMAVDVLIINGLSGTMEPSVVNDNTANMQSLQTELGNNSVVADMVPADLSIYDEVWDIRFDNSAAISAAEQIQYINFLQAGGKMVVMGENSTFMPRNNSILALIDALGGGLLSFVVPDSPQTVLAPFNAPNDVTEISYSSAGGVTSSGTGAFMSSDGSGRGSAVYFAVGSLPVAPAGELIVIFDVNFMRDDLDSGAASTLFLKNTLGIDENPEIVSGSDAKATPVPALSPLMVLLMSSLVGLVGVFRFNKK